MKRTAEQNLYSREILLQLGSGTEHNKDQNYIF